MLQEVVDGSGMELRGREYLILVHKVFRVQQVIQDQLVHRELQVLKVLLVLKVQLLHRVLKVLLEVMVLKVQRVLQVQQQYQTMQTTELSLVAVEQT